MSGLFEVPSDSIIRQTFVYECNPIIVIRKRKKFNQLPVERDVTHFIDDNEIE